MIRELSISGFKSFGTTGQKIGLGNLNFIVGANASGKTNFVSALRFLQLAVREGTEFAVNEFGGIGEVRNRILRERRSPKPMTLSIVMDGNEIRLGERKGSSLQISEFRYSLSLDLRQQSGIPQVQSETVIAEIRDKNGREIPYKLQRSKDVVQILDHTDWGPTKQQTLKVPNQESTRLALGVGLYSLPTVILRDLILNWRFYNISPDRARLPFKETPEIDLGPHGENLAVVLHKIEQMNGKGTLESIISGLKGAVPGFKGIKPIKLPVEGKWAFQVIEERIKGAINPDSVSDGTIRLLALMVITSWAAHDTSLLVIEEPENGLHPHLSEHIVSLLRSASQRKQTIVTTHNPAFLDHLEPHEVLLCDKLNGFTKIRRASDIDQIDQFRKHFRLGELWIQGTLGGIP
jgi:predicted ATPase